MRPNAFVRWSMFCYSRHFLHRSKVIERKRTTHEESVGCPSPANGWHKERSVSASVDWLCASQSAACVLPGWCVRCCCAWFSSGLVSRLGQFTSSRNGFRLPQRYVLARVCVFVCLCPPAGNGKMENGHTEAFSVLLCCVVFQLSRCNATHPTASKCSLPSPWHCGLCYGKCLILHTFPLWDDVVFFCHCIWHCGSF